MENTFGETLEETSRYSLSDVYGFSSFSETALVKPVKVGTDITVNTDNGSLIFSFNAPSKQVQERIEKSLFDDLDDEDFEAADSVKFSLGLLLSCSHTIWNMTRRKIELGDERPYSFTLSEICVNLTRLIKENVSGRAALMLTRDGFDRLLTDRLIRQIGSTLIYKELEGQHGKRISYGHLADVQAVGECSGLSEVSYTIQIASSGIYSEKARLALLPKDFIPYGTVISSKREHRIAFRECWAYIERTLADANTTGEIILRNGFPVRKARIDMDEVYSFFPQNINTSFKTRIRKDMENYFIYAREHDSFTFDFEWYQVKKKFQFLLVYLQAKETISFNE